MKLRGLLGLSCLLAFPVATLAGQQFKFVDMAPPTNSAFVTGTRSAGISEVTNEGVLSAESGGYDSTGQFVGMGLVWKGSGPWRVTGLNKVGAGTNRNGDVIYNGGYANWNYYDKNTGGTIRYADGTEVAVPTTTAHPFACARDINDSGVVVGHYSTYVYTTYPEFDFGRPFYMKNGVVTMPFGLEGHGSFCSVDKSGRAFLDSGGYWSPDEGYVYSSYLFGGTYNYRTDINDHLQMISYENDPHNGNWTAAINSMYSRRIIDAPSFVPLDSNDYEPGGLNNSGQLVTAYYRKIVGNTRQWHWCYWDGSSWTDLYALLKPQIPTGWTFERVKDIDDSGRIYGSMK